MKVLLLGSHLGYNLEHYVKMALERLGCEVRFLGYREFVGRIATPVRLAISRSKTARTLVEPFALRKFNNAAMQTSIEFQPELVLSIKGEAVLPDTVEWLSARIGARTALWYPDDPRYFNSLVHHIAPSYDHVFTPSERAIPKYSEIGCGSVHFLPFACEPSVHKRIDPTEEERNRYGADVVFVGTYNRRRSSFIDELERKHIDVKVCGPYWKYIKPVHNVYRGVYGPEMVKVFNAGKIVLNVHVESDLPYKANMRLFEAAGCGSFLLSDRPYGLSRLFEPGNEIICYNDEKHLVELAGYYLTDEEEKTRVATRLQQRAYKDHTYLIRMQHLLKKVK